MCSWCESIDYVVNGNVQCPITGDKRRLFRNAEVTSTPTNTSVQEPNTLFFARNDTSTSLRSIHIIIDPSQPVLEPNLSFSGDVFDGCFGIPFHVLFFYTYSFASSFQKNNLPVKDQ